jgi:beta-lactamase class A
MVKTLILCLCLICANFGLAAEPVPLDSKLHKLISGHQGKVAVALEHLRTGEKFFYHADDVMPTASLIKLAVMCEAYFQAAAGKVKLDDKITLTKEEMVPGSGILTDHFTPGATFCLRDAVHLMIVYSDNTATNLVLNEIGIKPVNERMSGLGLKETRINAKVFKGSTTSVDPARTKQYGLGSTTAREMLTLLEMLHKGELVSADASKAMIEHMKKCEDKDKFPRFLPTGVIVAHKTGSVNNARTDAGLIYFKEGPVALVVLTNDNQDKGWTPDNAGNKLCADVARAVVDFYQHPASKSGESKK